MHRKTPISGSELKWDGQSWFLTLTCSLYMVHQNVLTIAPSKGYVQKVFAVAIKYKITVFKILAQLSSAVGLHRHMLLHLTNILHSAGPYLMSSEGTLNLWACAQVSSAVGGGPGRPRCSATASAFGACTEYGSQQTHAWYYSKRKPFVRRV